MWIALTILAAIAAIIAFAWPWRDRIVAEARPVGRLVDAALRYWVDRFVDRVDEMDRRRR